MLIKYKKHIAYICPYCSSVSEKDISAFDFQSRSATEICCKKTRCHETCLTVIKKFDKYKITLECPVCGETHVNHVSQGKFWNKKLFTLVCPNSGMEVFFAGTKSAVHKAFNDNSEMFRPDSGQEYSPGDEQAIAILTEILEEVYMLDASDSISCSCGSRNIGIAMAEDGIALVCKECGQSLLLRSNAKTLNMLNNAETLIINNKK